VFDRLCCLLDANRDGRGEFEWVVKPSGVRLAIGREGDLRPGPL